jgi:hypothetical protein
MTARKPRHGPLEGLRRLAAGDPGFDSPWRLEEPYEASGAATEPPRDEARAL